MCDPTWEVCSLQKDVAPAGPPKDGPKNATDGKPAKKEGPSKEFLTEVAVKFVNAMWATMFARVLSVGLQQWTRSVGYYNASDSSTQTSTISPSVAFKSYRISGYMLIGWGLYGWTAFLAKRFAKNSKMVKRMALMAAQGNALVGLALLGLSGWKTASRDKCSTNAYWQCWYDSSPTSAQTWSNGNYTSQSRTSYLLALQMMWLSKSTTKYLSADLKFQDKKKKKAEDKKDAKKDGKKDEKKKGDKKGPGPAAQKLQVVAEQLAWGL